MATGGAIRIITSTSGAERLKAATAFLHESSLAQDVLLVASSRGAADDLARHAATGRGASLGWHRFSLLQLAARLGVDALTPLGRLPGSPLVAEAVASRAIFGAIAGGNLRDLHAGRSDTRIPRAVARTIGERRLAGSATRWRIRARRGPDWRRCWPASIASWPARGAAHRHAAAHVGYRALANRAAVAMGTGAGRRLVIVDPVLAWKAELRFVHPLAAAAAQGLIAFPAGDSKTAWRGLPRSATCRSSRWPRPAGEGSRSCRHAHFQAEVSGADPPDQREVVSAPGEAREAIQIARRVLAEAQRGVLFDEMAVLVRAPAAVPRPARACAGTCRAFPRASIAGLASARSGGPRHAGLALLRRRRTVGAALR